VEGGGGANPPPPPPPPPLVPSWWEKGVLEEILAGPTPRFLGPRHQKTREWTVCHPRQLSRADRSQVPSKLPPVQPCLKTKVSRALPGPLNGKSLELPKCVSYSKNYRIPCSSIRTSKPQRRPAAFHMHVSGKWRQTTLGMNLLREGPGFPKRERGYHGHGGRRF
jgi:hypothetical protein